MKLKAAWPSFKCVTMLRPLTFINKALRGLDSCFVASTVSP